MTLKTLTEIKKSKPIQVGVVGYSSGKFDKERAEHLVFAALNVLYNRYEGNMTIVSGLTDLGIPGLAYQYAKRENLKTVGIACAKAEEYKCFPVDKRVIVGKDWGDESQYFLSSIDFMVRVGGGPQSHNEVREFKKMHGEKNIIEYELERESE